eukprot:TRINITY_DN6130_c0_g2_i1.p1 TRINITY_DN6130_c0_g2~~TRINITY_DN6130_c0_g2_i1.p1  ORF type:complete len:732 (-),score=175.78 TRINITY_DN6130_c0_g2_i1:81-2276(-)
MAVAAVYHPTCSMARVQGLPFAMAQSPTMYARVIEADSRSTGMQQQHVGSPQPMACTYLPTVARQQCNMPAMPLQHRPATSQQHVFYAAPLPQWPQQKNAACMAPSRPSCAATQPALAPAPSANSVMIGTRTFDRVRTLGSGSFGVVWEVTETSGKSSKLLALKKSKVKKENKEMIEACLLEAEVLRELVQRLPATIAEQNFVPRYETHCCLSNAGQMDVLLAMSKLNGTPLDCWLYGVDERKLNTMTIEAILDGPLPDGQRSTKTLEQACDFTLALINQMTPIFETLQTIAFHRDISAHNFLINAEGQKPHFSVLDFGLAVRSSSWKREWHGRNIAGDPRYFSPAAWMQLTHGFKYLENNPRTDWKQQYVDRLDHYSFGILICELLFGLWQGPAEFEDQQAEISAAWRTNLEAARQSWRTYWGTCVSLCQRFHTEGLRAVRHHLAGGHLDAAAEQMQALCTSLARAARQGGSGSGDPRAAALLQTAAELIDPRSSVGWQELKLRMAQLPEGFASSSPCAAQSEEAELAPAAKEKEEDVTVPSPVLSAADEPPQNCSESEQPVQQLEQPGQEEADASAMAASAASAAIEASAASAANEASAAGAGVEASAASAAVEASTASAAVKAPAASAAVEASAASVATAAVEPPSPPPTLLNSNRRSQSEETRAAKVAEAAPASTLTSAWKPAAHRRNWTLDSPWALLRGVVQVGLCHGWRGAAGPELQLREETQTA